MFVIFWSFVSQFVSDDPGKEKKMDSDITQTRYESDYPTKTSIPGHGEAEQDRTGWNIRGQDRTGRSSTTQDRVRPNKTDGKRMEWRQKTARLYRTWKRNMTHGPAQNRT